ncbi:MAG: dihydroorotate dehydrogenase electron transfer subunit [Promethearchaeia archaeon]
MNKYRPKIFKIKRIINECKDVKTFIIKTTDLETPKPGQFVMVWVPGVDEVPMSISGYDNKGNWAITVKKIGECTAAMHNLHINDYIGIRGPLGNHFQLPSQDKEIFLVAGGIGAAPLKCFAFDLSKKGYSFTFIEGAQIHNQLMFMDQFRIIKKKDSEFLYCTDDGSYGKEGFATNIFIEKINEYSKEKRSNIIVYTCGPEKMIYELYQICKQNHLQMFASLERNMRCGCGLCGLCALDPLGLTVCQDGPIFDSKILEKLDDFGKFKRKFEGTKEKISN